MGARGRSPASAARRAEWVLRRLLRLDDAWGNDNMHYMIKLGDVLKCGGVVICTVRQEVGNY